MGTYLPPHGHGIDCTTSAYRPAGAHQTTSPYRFPTFGTNVHRGLHGVVSNVLVLRFNQEMLRPGLDHCKNEKYTNTQIQKYRNTWIIALAMSRRRRILLVFMALSIGCYCQFITSGW